MRDAAAFKHRLRAWLERDYAGLHVPERHKDGVHWHVHVYVGFFVPKEVVRQLSRKGFIDIRLIRDSAGRGDSRAAAAYAGKYIGKELAAGEGRHAYEVTQGFQPTEEVLDALDLDDGEHAAVLAFGGEVPSYRWSSEEASGSWEGPPLRFLTWGEDATYG